MTKKLYDCVRRETRHNGFSEHAGEKNTSEAGRTCRMARLLRSVIVVSHGLPDQRLSPAHQGAEKV